MRTLPYICTTLAIFFFSSCGKETVINNNGTFDNNGTASSNNGSTGLTSGSNNGMTTISTNNNTNNQTVATTATTNGTTGTNNTSGTTGTNNRSGIARVSKELAEVYCEIAFNCDGRNATFIRSNFGQRFETQAECNVGLLTLFDAQFFEQLNSETAGRLQTDNSEVDRCIQEIKSAYCQGPLAALETSCESLFIGTVADNGLCVTSEECSTTEAYCDKPQNSCEGVCTPNARLCGGVSCSADQFCKNTTQTCEPRIGNGGACDRNQCLTGSYCNLANQGGICQVAGSVDDGGPCSTDDLCTIKSVCESRVCTAIGAKKKLNEQCSPSECEIGLLCTNLSFISGFGTCLPARDIGESCVSEGECKWGLKCDGADRRNEVRGTCQPAGADGEACNRQFDCKSFNCVSNVCEAKVVCIP